MCWERDYKFFAEQKKAQESRIRGEQRSGVIHQLLNEANKQGESTNVEGTQVKEVAPATTSGKSSLTRRASITCFA